MGEGNADSLSVLLGTGALREFIKNQFMESQFITFILPNGDVASRQLSVRITFGKGACPPEELPGEWV